MCKPGKEEKRDIEKRGRTQREKDRETKKETAREREK